RERVADRRPEVAGVDLAAPSIDPADDAVVGGEPDAPVPVGKRRDDLVVGGQPAAHVEVAAKRQAGSGCLGDDEDVARGGGRNDAVGLVEIEVAAPAEV